MAQLIGEKAMNSIVSQMDGVHDAVRDQAGKTEKIAEQRLQRARSTTGWVKIADPDGMTRITVTEGDVDYFVNMEAPKEGAMAIEYGHAPSGVFGPGGRYADVKTRAPMGLYIMTGAYIQS